MSERFWKLHGLGNDFIVIDRRAAGAAPSPSQAQARAWCDRKRGIGAAGVLTLLPGDLGRVRMRVTNADGSLAEMCGNGLRCVARLVSDLEPGASAFAVDTDAGLRRVTVEGDQVECEMGAPLLTPKQIPMAAAGERFVQGEVTFGVERVRGTAVSMGNPHLVLWGAPAARAATWGPALEHHPLFPQRTNVEFVALRDGGLDVVVWERGCGLTEACGTGACASVVAGILEGRLPAGADVEVRLPGGTLRVRVAADLSQVWMRGQAVRVFEGDLP
jgi:diaminopimelate epimerase